MISNFKSISHFSLIALFLILLSLPVYSQKLSAELKMVDSLVTLKSGNLIKDVNGDICSIVIVSTGLSGLKFYSNLGVEKIENNESGFRVWIPNKSNLLKISVPDFPLFEYNLPASNFKYSVFIISLIAEKSENTIVLDTIKPNLSFTSLPANAEIFMNGGYTGKSPLTIKNPGLRRFDYSIEKKGYLSYSASDSIGNKSKNISVELKPNLKAKRIFFSANIGLEWPVTDFTSDMGMYIYSVGVLGKTGAFGSLIHINSVAAKIKKIGMVCGLTGQIGKTTFLFGGPGYIKRNYTDFSGKQLEEESFNLNAGIIKVIGRHFQLKFDYSKSVNNKYQAVGLGLGFNFFLQ